MSAFCDLALALGLTLSGTCQPAAPAANPLPADDPHAWSFKAPEPKVEAPPPAPKFPPVVITKIIREPAPAPAPPPSPPPSAPEAPAGPDPVEQAITAAYQRRAAGIDAWGEVAAPVSQVTTPEGGMAPPSPLDLAAMVHSGSTSKYKEKRITSSGPVDNSRIVTTDRYISGILETGINTQLDGSTGGPVVIQTTRDVFGYHARNILIPKGSRLVCEFKSLSKVGASRAPLTCSRILLGGSRAEIYGAKAHVTDVQGALGVSGDVDNRFFERYGTAFILAGISAAVTAASNGANSVQTSSTSSALGSTSSYNGTSGALASGATQLAQQLGQITAATLQQTINLAPILRVAQGTRVQIRPNTDWYIAKMGVNQ